MLQPRQLISFIIFVASILGQTTALAVSSKPTRALQPEPPALAEHRASELESPRVSSASLLQTRTGQRSAATTATGAAGSSSGGADWSKPPFWWRSATADADRNLAQQFPWPNDPLNAQTFNPGAAPLQMNRPMDNNEFLMRQNAPG